MIPAEFDYVAPSSVDEAIGALRDGGEDAKLIAGGHSLLPLMKLRLAAPTLLVDLRRVDGLSGVRRNGGVSIGALTTHSALAGEGLGVLSEAICPRW
jgi:aerobic carbon-monoxide dehydrogenase medium subunit